MKHSISLMTLIVFVASMPILLGCAQKVPSSSEDEGGLDKPSLATEVQPVSLRDDTPEAVFASMREATEDRDYYTFAAYWTDSSQDKIAVGLVQHYLLMLEQRQQGIRTNANAMGEIVESYEIDVDSVAAILNAAGMTQDELIAEAGKLIHDKPAFIGDAMMLINQDSSEDEYIQGEIDSIVIEGERAVGWCVLPEDGGEMKIEFINTPEGWRIELPEGESVEEVDEPE